MDEKAEVEKREEERVSLTRTGTNGELLGIQCAVMLPFPLFT